MTDERTFDTSSYVKVAFPVLTLLIFFALLNISNAGERIVDLTVADVLFALFWIFIIDISIIGILIVIFIIFVLLTE